MNAPRVLADGFAYVESPRWHDGRLWFSHWGAEEVVAVDLDGNVEVVAAGRPGVGWATGWLTDGCLLITGETLLRREPDGSFVQHADLVGLTGRGGEYPGGCDELVVDHLGRAYVSSIEFDFLEGSDPAGGVLVLVEPDGSARQVAEGLSFPNGMVITPDGSTLIIGESFAGKLTAFDITEDGSLTGRRTWAEGVGPDGITMDAEDGIWCSSAPMASDAVRVLEGGEVTDRIELDQSCFACMLGGPEGRHLFLLTAEWAGPALIEKSLAKRTGTVLVTEVDVPHAGRP